MNHMTANSWYEDNQRYLSAVLAVIQGALQQHLARMQATEVEEIQNVSRPTPEDIAASMTIAPALDTLCATFCLSSFERDLLVLCAGIELDASFASLCATAQGDPHRVSPTFSLALAALPEAHWSALTPTAPLRYWRLITVGAGSTLTLSPLRIDERILHYLAGVQHTDERLLDMLEPLSGPIDVVPSHQAIADQIVAAWSSSTKDLPVVQLCGEDVTGKHAINATACAMLEWQGYVLAGSAVSTLSSEVESFLRLWEREAALCGSVLLIDCEAWDEFEPVRQNVIARLIERLRSRLLIVSRERLSKINRTLVTFDVQRPTPKEQRAVWQAALGTDVPQLNEHLDAVISQFDLHTQAIYAASEDAMKRVGQGAESDLSAALWNVCRTQARPRLEDLAQRITSAVTWDDLVLPEPQKQILRTIAAHVQQRATVYERWGFASKGTRGLGISALFAGASGTGKTLAAEVLANSLSLDLYRIDLSAVVSKYIGETEKNLRRIFDAAEQGGAILLFDEADALFGKRSEVKDSHDRHANIEVSYLLQRMECYRGLAILTTNLKHALDTAFLRRIRFIVQFPFPDTSQRAEIWRRVFPLETPVQDLNIEVLARLNIAGGNIRNIALNAAFLAADAGECVQTTHLLQATHAEYAKLEKSLTDAETTGWLSISSPLNNGTT